MRAGKPLTVTDPEMTRFLMSLDEAVLLVEHAFAHAAARRPLHPQGSGLARSRSSRGQWPRPGRGAEIQVIGTRHGEKLYETLATREELARAEDQGDYFRVAVDARDLNYGEYFDEGDARESAMDDYHSHNTERLDVDEVVDLLIAARLPRADRCST